MSDKNSTKTLSELISDIRTFPAHSAQFIADALEAVDARLKILEPCPKRRGDPHTWVPVGKRYTEDPGDPLRCGYCGLTKVSL